MTQLASDHDDDLKLEMISLYFTGILYDVVDIVQNCKPSQAGNRHGDTDTISDIVMYCYVLPSNCVVH